MKSSAGVGWCCIDVNVIQYVLSCSHDFGERTRVLLVDEPPFLVIL